MANRKGFSTRPRYTQANAIIDSQKLEQGERLISAVNRSNVGVNEALHELVSEAREANDRSAKRDKEDKGVALASVFASLLADGTLQEVAETLGYYWELGRRKAADGQSLRGEQ